MKDECEIRNGWRHRANDLEGFEALQADGVPDAMIEKVLTPSECKAYLDWLYINIK